MRYVGALATYLVAGLLLLIVLAMLGKEGFIGFVLGMIFMHIGFRLELGYWFGDRR